MDNFEKNLDNQKPEKPEGSHLNLFQEFEIIDEKSGAMRAKDSFGEERLITPARPPILEKQEEAERHRAGVEKLIDQLPSAARLEIKEKARIAAADEIQKRQHLLTPAQAGEEFSVLTRQKEWELAAEWLKNNSENEQRPAA